MCVCVRMCVCAHVCVCVCEDLNEELEAAEQRKKDELKQRREATKQQQNQNGWGAVSRGVTLW